MLVCMMLVCVYGRTLCSISVPMFVFLFKQKTAYEMRISDWSSDVCSSDLQARGLRLVLRAFEQFELPRRPAPAIGAGFAQPEEFFGDRIEIGRASCRESVCQYV